MITLGLVLETGIVVTTAQIITTAAALIIAEFLLENPNANLNTVSQDGDITFTFSKFEGQVTLISDARGYSFTIEESYSGEIEYGQYQIARGYNSEFVSETELMDEIRFNVTSEFEYTSSLTSPPGFSLTTAILENYDTGETIELDLTNGGNLEGGGMVTLQATVERTIDPTPAQINDGLKDIKGTLDGVSTKINNIETNVTSITEVTQIIEADLGEVTGLISGLYPHISSNHAQTQAHISSEVGQVLTLSTGISATLDVLSASESDRFTTLTGLIENIAVEPPEVDLSEVISRLEALFQQGVEHGTDIRYGVTLDEQILTDLTALITEIGELETPEIDMSSIQQRLEQIFQQGSATQDDLRLAAGVISDIFDLSTQIMEEAEKIKQDTEKCSQEDEEEDDNCCEEVREILERLKASQTATYGWYENCETDQVSAIEVGGAAFSGILNAVVEVLNKLNEVNRNLCGIEAIASLPEGWNLRPENKRPQLIVQLATVVEGKIGRADRQITIPHYSGGRQVPPISYTSGNHYGMLVLKDNSKVRVYAASQGQAEGICNQIKGMISGTYSQGSYVVTGTIQGDIQRHELVAMGAVFYGADHEPGKSPEWVVRNPRD